MDAESVIRTLGLVPMPEEGGYYRETYRSAETVPHHALPARYWNDKTFSTAIYYLVTPDSYSMMHRIPSDEIFHFYLGDPVEMLMLRPDGKGDLVTLGADITGGSRPQCVVPRHVWQGLCLVEGGRFALLGTTVAPGFDFDDYEHGDRAGLTGEFPGFTSHIIRFTAS